MQRKEEDLSVARASELWGEAVGFLKRTIAPGSKSHIRARIEQDPERWWVGGHFRAGMLVRNCLRVSGYGEKEFGITNLDNIYVELLEEAVQ